MVQEVSPQSPEERRKRSSTRERLARLGPGSRIYEVAKRVFLGVFNDGFIHAGNLAYLTLLTLFPFFIVTAALAQLFGRNEDTIRALSGLLSTMPPSVAELLQQPILDVLGARSGSLLWLGAAVGLWTVASFIETIRDILRRAYGTPFSAPFWQYRLGSIGMIIVAVILAMIAFSAQVLMTAAEQFIYNVIPYADDVAGWIRLSRIVPLLVLTGALYVLFYSLTPSRYRFSNAPKWPGAVMTASWWALSLLALPTILALLGGYDLTYGSLAGVIVALFFFWLVGFGFVVGAHLNAALAEPHDMTLKPGAETAEA